MGATRPIPMAFMDNLALSGDGKTLYAANRSNHAVFAYDVAAMIAEVNANSEDLLSRFPVDDISGGSLATTSIVIGGVTHYFRENAAIDIKAGYSIERNIFGIPKIPYVFGNWDPARQPIATGGNPQGLDTMPNIGISNFAFRVEGVEDQFFNSDTGAFEMKFLNDSALAPGSTNSDMIVKFVTDGPISRFIAGGALTPITISPGDVKTQRISMKAIDLKNLGADQLYGSTIRVLVFKRGSGVALYDKEISVARFVAALDPTGPSFNSLFTKTLADLYGGFIREKDLNYFLPTGSTTKLSIATLDDFDLARGVLLQQGSIDLSGTGTAKWSFDPFDARVHKTDMTVEMNGHELPSVLKLQGTAIAPVKIDVNLTDYQKELKNVILSLRNVWTPGPDLKPGKPGGVNNNTEYGETGSDDVLEVVHAAKPTAVVRVQTRGLDGIAGNGDDVMRTVVNYGSNAAGTKGWITYNGDVHQLFQVASPSFKRLLAGYMPSDRQLPGADGTMGTDDDEFSAVQLAALDTVLAAQAVALKTAIKADFDPVNGLYGAYTFVDGIAAADGVTMVWEQDRFWPSAAGYPVFGSAPYDADTTNPAVAAGSWAGWGDQNGDGVELYSLFSNANLSIGAKMWGLAESLNNRIVEQGGFGEAINMMWDPQVLPADPGYATFAQYVANTISHEVGHTFGLMDAYTFESSPYLPPNSAGARVDTNTKPFDIMMSGGPRDPNLTFVANNLQLLRAAMGISANTALALKSAVQQYRDTINLPNSVNGIREDGVIVEDGQSIPTYRTQPQIVLTNGDFAVFDQGSVAFGSVATDGLGGRSLSLDYEIANVGYSPLKISSLLFLNGGQGFSVVDTGLVGQEIAPGESATLTLKFDPAVMGDHTDMLQIESNGSAAPLQLTLTGRGLSAGGSIDISYTSNNLGSYLIGGDGIANTKRMTVTNVGTGPLSIYDIRSVLNTGEFFVTVPAGLDSRTPLVLQEGEAVSFDVWFRAQNPGLRAGKIQLLTSESEVPITTGLLLGTGIADELSDGGRVGNDYVAVETIDGVLLGRTLSDSSGVWSLKVRAGTQVHIVIFDPETGQVSHELRTAEGSGLLTESSQVTFAVSTADDSDGDGLPDDIQFALGNDTAARTSLFTAMGLASSNGQLVRPSTTTDSRAVAPLAVAALSDGGFALPARARDPSLVPTSVGSGASVAPLSGLTSVATATGLSNTGVVDATTLAALAAQARALWSAAGADITPLLGVQLNVADLQGALLGLVALTGATPTLTLDINGAGNGWFVDTTPAANEEFGTVISSEALRADSGSALGRMDLLTVIAHEFGHILGLQHVDVTVAPNSLLRDALPTGMRRVPVIADLTRLLTGTIINGQFSVDDPTFYEYGWSTRGGATVANGVGVLREDAQRASGLRQVFELPGAGQQLQFTITGGALSTATGIPPDAFEVALIDPTTMQPLVGTIGLSGSDAFFNLQSDGTLLLGAGVTVTNLQGVVLTTIDFSQPVIVTLDLSALPAGTHAALYFDLLGFGALDSTISVDDVRFVDQAVINQPPVANNDSATVAEDASVLIDVLANDTDPEGDARTITGVGLAAHGSVVVEAGQIRYRPDANYSGSDAFTYAISDSAGNPATASVSVTVQPVNDAPVIAAIGDVTLVAGLPFTTTALASDIDGDTLSFRLDQAPLGATIDATTGRIDWTAAGIGTAAQFTVTVLDGQAQASSSFRVNVVAPGTVNQDPLPANDVASVALNGTVLIDVLANDNDPDGNALTLIAVSVAANGGAVTIESNRVRYTPVTGFSGSDTFTYTVSDGAGGTATAQVSVAVNQVGPVNQAPLGVDDAVTLDEDTSLLFDARLNDSDPDGDPLTIVSITQPTHGVAVLENGLIRYTPSANYHGPDTLFYRLSDGLGLEDTARVTITISPLNDAPVAVADTASLAEDTSVLIDVLANDADIDGDALTLVIAAGPQHGTATIENGRVRYTPAANYNGADTFTYRVVDPAGASAEAVGHITINPVNDAPLLAPVASTRVGSNSLFRTRLVGSDVDGDLLTYYLVNGVGGALLDPTTGWLSWTTGRVASTAQFTVVVRDPLGAEAARSFTVTVRPPVVEAALFGQAPLAVANPSVSPSTRVALRGTESGNGYLLRRDVPLDVNLAPLATPVGRLSMPNTIDGSSRVARMMKQNAASFAASAELFATCAESDGPSGMSDKEGFRLPDPALPKTLQLLWVESFVPLLNGFAVRFNDSIMVDRNDAVRTLVDAATDSEVVILGPDGRPVSGTIALDADGRGFHFTAIAGALAPGAYEVTLKSGLLGFHSFFGNLDGDRDGQAGGDAQLHFQRKDSAPAAQQGEADNSAGDDSAAAALPAVDFQQTYAGFLMAGAVAFNATSRRNKAPREDREWRAKLLAPRAHGGSEANLSLTISLED